ncbi:MAG: N,N-dimethylformamidase beta subunit family domain-containing protein [Verrucomicrobiota bacterium]
MKPKHARKSSGIERRAFLKGTAAVVGALAAGSVDAAAATRRQSSLIKKENQKAGSPDWQLTRVRLDKAQGYRSPWIEGYCSQQSIEAGQSLRIMVSTKPARRFIIEIFRTGYYGGRGARLMATVGPFKGVTQPDPPVGERRLRECRWEPATGLTIPADWPSGVYLGRLTTLPESAEELYWQSYVIFIVRDRRPADILFQCSDNTWQAYNRWPDNYSLYTNPEGALKPGADVSFDRPYGKYVQIYENPQSVGSGEYLCWEFPLAYWLEQQGYDVTYCSNSDLLDASQATRCKTFISVGHDEYWDLRQYHATKAAIDAGVNALFLSGNAVCFVSPFRASTDGRANRIITRAGRYGGMTELETKTYKFMGPFPVTDAPNENLLMGARTITPFNGGGDWIVSKPEHWMFAGTGMKKGDAIPGLVGWEFHGDPAPIPGLEIVAEGMALSGGTNPAHWTATVYPGPHGNYVFNAATIWWSQGLSNPPGHMLPWSHWSRPHGPDERVQRMMENLLRRAVG